MKLNANYEYYEMKFTPFRKLKYLKRQKCITEYRYPLLAHMLNVYDKESRATISFDWAKM